MSRFADDAERFEEAIELAEVLETMRALLPEGLESLPRPLARALDRDDFGQALALARERYSERGAGDLEAVVAYVALLHGRDLIREAGGVLRRAQDIQEREVALQLLQVENLMAQGKWGAARELLGGLSEVALGRPPHWAFMGDAYLELGDDLDAIGAYRAAVDAGLKDADVAYRLGRLLFERDETEEAARALERAARLAVHDHHLWALVAEAWGELGEYEREAEARGRVVGLEDHDAQAWLVYGESLMRAGRKHEAVEALEEAAELDPFDLEAQVRLGHLRFDLGQVEQALQIYRRLLERRPEHLPALHGAAAAAFEQGDVALAEEMARRALERAPERAETHYNLGVILDELRRSPEALERLRQAVALDPAPAHRAALALALVRAEHLEEAVALAEQLWASGEPARAEAAAALLEVAEALVSRGHAQPALQVLQGREHEAAGWALMRPLLEYVARATLVARDLEPEHQRERLAQLEAALEAALEGHDEELPLVWEFGGLERLARQLERGHRRVIERTIRRLERME